MGGSTIQLAASLVAVAAARQSTVLTEAEASQRMEEFDVIVDGK